MDNKKIAVILVNYKDYAKKFLSECRDSLRNQNYPKELFQVYIIDNATSSETRKYLKKMYPEVKVVPRDDGNYAAANNAGIKAGLDDGCAYFVIANMDTRFDVNWLSELIIALEKYDNNGIVQSKLLLYPKAGFSKKELVDVKARSFGFGYCRKHYVSYKRYGRALILPKYNCKICNIEFTARPNYRNARIKEIKNLYCNKCHILGYRNFIINKLGGKCECCKEKEIIFLEIDHIKGKGGKHRKKYSGSGMAGRYAYLDDILKKNKSYRVLCRNCNWGVFRGKNGICPHKQLKK